MLPYAEVVGGASGKDCADICHTEVAASEAVYVTFEFAVRAVKRRGDFGTEGRDTTRRIGTVENDDALGAGERRPDLSHRQRTERCDAQEADSLAFVAQLADGVLRTENDPSQPLKG